MFVMAVRSVMESLFALLCVLGPVAAYRSMRRGYLSKPACRPVSICLTKSAQSQNVTYDFKDTLIKIQTEAHGPQKMTMLRGR